MIHALIGHRGVGKTRLLERIGHYYQSRKQDVITLDLDHEIIVEHKCAIEHIFAEKGEQGFRQLEIEMFDRLLNKYGGESKPVYIALGAGFKGHIPMYVKVLWVQRPSDRYGRVFLDRPRLQSDVPPLEEYFMRAEARQKRYREIYHKEILFTEGFQSPNEIEPVLLSLTPYELKANMTVLPQLFANEVRLEDFIADKLQLGVHRFELRDDLLSVEQIDKFAREVAADRLLFSFRTADRSAINEKWRWAAVYDWALELGPCPFGAPPMLSLHKRQNGESVEDCGQRLVREEAEHYKLAVPVDDFIELWQGHQWYLEEPAKRSFLPVSKDGRWSWYRLIHGQKMKVSFVRDSLGSAPDQPSLFEWIRLQTVHSHDAKPSFAAVLGDPVDLSQTPSEHNDYFARRGWSVVALPMRENELNEVNMSILRRMGLQAAAVTAPLKGEAFRLCGDLTPESRRLKSVNTLVWNLRTQTWAGENTDVIALEKIFEALDKPSRIAVWGGGGTRRALQTALPQAVFFSARTGREVGADEPDAGAENRPWSPELLIWAVGRDRMSQCQWPPLHWRPLMIFDLNYVENSPGREYAQRLGATYISGIEMFQEQAKAQRKFWDALLPQASEGLLI